MLCVGASAARAGPDTIMNSSTNFRTEWERVLNNFKAIDGAKIKARRAKAKEEIYFYSKEEFAGSTNPFKVIIRCGSLGYDPSLPLAFKVANLFKMPIEDIFEP